MKPLTDEYIAVSKLTVADLPIQRSDSIIRAAAKGQWAKVIAGRAMNAREMGDRIEGPVTQRHDVEFIPGSSLNVNVSGEVTEKREVEVGPTLGEVIREIYGLGPDVTEPRCYGFEPVSVPKKLGRGQEPPKDSDEGS